MFVESITDAIECWNVEVVAFQPVYPVEFSWHCASCTVLHQAYHGAWLPRWVQRPRPPKGSIGASVVPEYLHLQRNSTPCRHLEGQASIHSVRS
jgi:hypothetical protein